MSEQNKKPEYEEIDIDLNKHDVEIHSTTKGNIKVLIDGTELRRIKRLNLDSTFVNTEEDLHKKTLKAIIHCPER